jgi:hypothetical protein
MLIEWRKFEFMRKFCFVLVVKCICHNPLNYALKVDELVTTKNTCDLSLFEQWISTYSKSFFAQFIYAMKFTSKSCLRKSSIHHQLPY